MTFVFFVANNCHQQSASRPAERHQIVPLQQSVVFAIAPACRQRPQFLDAVDFHIRRRLDLVVDQAVDFVEFAKTFRRRVIARIV